MRQLTSHERRAGRPWDASYHDGAPPWDIGAPQPAIIRLAAEDRFAGAVLDASTHDVPAARAHLASLLPRGTIDPQGAEIDLATRYQVTLKFGERRLVPRN